MKDFWSPNLIKNHTGISDVKKGRRLRRIHRNREIVIWFFFFLLLFFSFGNCFANAQRFFDDLTVLLWTCQTVRMFLFPRSDSVKKFWKFLWIWLKKKKIFLRGRYAICSRFLSILFSCGIACRFFRPKLQIFRGEKKTRFSLHSWWRHLRSRILGLIKNRNIRWIIGCPRHPWRHKGHNLNAIGFNFFSINTPSFRHT